MSVRGTSSFFDSGIGASPGEVAALSNQAEAVLSMSGTMRLKSPRVKCIDLRGGVEGFEFVAGRAEDGENGFDDVL